MSSITLDEKQCQSATPTTPYSEGRAAAEVMAALVGECHPDTVLWRTLDGQTYTAAQLAEHIRRRSEIGLQYASDLLRISRDFLRRASNRQHPPSESKETP